MPLESTPISKLARALAHWAVPRWLRVGFEGVWEGLLLRNQSHSATHLGLGFIFWDIFPFTLIFSVCLSISSFLPAPLRSKHGHEQPFFAPWKAEWLCEVFPEHSYTAVTSSGVLPGYLPQPGQQQVEYELIRNLWPSWGNTSPFRGCCDLDPFLHPAVAMEQTVKGKILRGAVF